MKKNIFDFIAPIYGLFYYHQKKQFRKSISLAEKDIDIMQYHTIVDIGCGTGALCSVLHEKGFDVTGVDASDQMLNVARKQNRNESITFIQHDILQKLLFEEDFFDVSIASHVAHGLTFVDRKKMYQEMVRISKHLVIFHDYNQKRTVWTNIIEWLEGGDYFNYIKVVKKELEEHFELVQIINVSKKTAWYVCCKN